MRFLSIAVLSASLLVPSFSTAQQTPVPMQSTLDARLKDILQIVVGSVVGRVPGVIHDGTNFTVNDSTNLGQGAIDGLLNIQVGTVPADSDAKATPLFATQAQVAIRFFEGSTAESAVLNINTSGQLSTEAFIQFVQLLNQGICAVGAESTCTVKPVVDAADSALPVSQRGKLAIERLKANLIAYIDATVASSSGEEQQQSFGTSSDDSGSTVDVAKMEKMRVAVESGLQIAAQGADTLVTIDMNAIRSMNSDLAEINPALGALNMFTTIQITVSEAASNYVLVVQSEIPKRLIVNYDAYIKQQQSEDQLESLHTLVTKITWWASGRCTKEKYQEMCMTKLLNTCATNVDSVARCVRDAGLVQKARDVKNGIDSIFGN